MTITIDTFIITYAVLAVAFVFSGMRLLYGAWPWEFDKTWYATKPHAEYSLAMASVWQNKLKDNLDQLYEKVLRERVENLPPIPLGEPAAQRPKFEVIVQDADTFERPVGEKT